MAGRTDLDTRRHMYPPLGIARGRALITIARIRIAVSENAPILASFNLSAPNESANMGGKRRVRGHSPSRLSLSVGLFSSVHDPNGP